MTVRQLRQRLFDIEEQDSEATTPMVLRLLGEGPTPVREVNGRLVGIVEVALYELVDQDPDFFLLLLSRRLVGHEELADLDYKCVGSRGNTLFLEVSGIDESASIRTRESEVIRIAAEVLRVESLAEQGSDRADFV